jgi:hypothetical protein
LAIKYTLDHHFWRIHTLYIINVLLLDTLARYQQRYPGRVGGDQACGDLIDRGIQCYRDPGVENASAGSISRRIGELIKDRHVNTWLDALTKKTVAPGTFEKAGSKIRLYWMNERYLVMPVLVIPCPSYSIHRKVSPFMRLPYKLCVHLS